MGGPTQVPDYVAARLITPQQGGTSGPPPRRPDPRAPLYWMIGTLNIIVLALAAYIVVDEPEVIVQRTAATQTPGPEVQPEADEPEPVVVEAAVGGEPEVAVPGAPKAEAEAVAEEDTPRRRRGGRTKGRSNRGDPPPETASKPKPKPTAADKTGPADLPIECIMNPDRCDRGANGPRTAAQGPKQRKVEEDLPSTLGQSALRAGFGKVRAEAKACGPKHGVRGQQVAVKVSISGKSGSVTSARALGSHAKTAIGNCVASALRRASFDRFAKPQIGIRYTVRL